MTAEEQRAIRKRVNYAFHETAHLLSRVYRVMKEKHPQAAEEFSKEGDRILKAIDEIMTWRRPNDTAPKDGQ